MSATISDAVLSRVATLSAAAAAALDVAAVIGTTVEPWLLLEVSGAGSAAIDECLAAGLLREAEHQFAFRHELARAAISDTIPAYRRAALHGRVLRGLEGRLDIGINPARLAHHAEEAGDTDAVLRYAPEAARRADALGAAREAAEQYARALRFAAALPDGERLALLEAYEAAAGLSGWGAAGIQLRQEMIALARRCGDRLREADHLNWRALTLTLEHQKDEAQASARAARALLDQIAEGPVHARWHAHRSYWLTCFGPGHDALAESQRAFEIANRHDDFATTLYVLENLGSARFTLGDEDGGRADLERCAHLAAGAGLDVIFAMATVGLGIGLCGLVRLADAERFLCEAITFISEHGIDSQRYWATAAMAEVRLLQGRWPEAAALSTQVLSTHPEDFPEFAPPARARLPALLTLGKVRARRGDPDAWDLLDQAVRHAPPGVNVLRRATVAVVRAEAAWLAGDRPRAVAEASAVYPDVVTSGSPWLVGELAYWLWKARMLTEPSPQCAEPYALQMQGEWRAAAAAWSALGCPYEAARALAEADDAEALREALTALERLGAQPAKAQLVRRMRELGVGKIPRGPRAATRANPANLTARELDVLALMADGRRNAEIADRLFLSPKTIEHHVSSILGKLGVASRAEAISSVRRLDL